MSPEDRLILNFARTWIPYGGPSAADILVEFGMTPARFHDRLDAVVSSVEPRLFSAGERSYFASVGRREDTGVREKRGRRQASSE